MDPQMALLLPFLALILAWVQINNQTALSETQPRTFSVATSSMILCYPLSAIKLRFPRLYKVYQRVVPLDAYFFGILSFVSVISLLLPVLQPFVLLGPMGYISYWIFQKLENQFGETHFWTRNVDPSLSYWRRKMNRMETVLPQ